MRTTMYSLTLYNYCGGQGIACQTSFPLSLPFSSHLLPPCSLPPFSHQLEDCVRAVLGFEGFIASCPGQEPHHTSTQTSHYSEEEITYALFVHALSIIERVLLFTDGWKLFPMSIDSKGNAQCTHSCYGSVYTCDVGCAQ